MAPIGVSPDAEIVASKVLDSGNSSCCMSDTVAALDWIISDHPEVDVINMSLGTFTLYPSDCDALSATNLALAAAIVHRTASGWRTFLPPKQRF